jgi:hypothetical protein
MCRQKNNITIDLRKVAVVGGDWIHLAKYWGQRWALVNTVEKLRVP